MATFPALAPNSRRYTFAQYPISEERGFGGGSVRFLHGWRASGHGLALQYLDLTDAEAAILRDHYRGQQGSFLSFLLSEEAWGGNAIIPRDIGGQPVAWKYAEKPEETQKRGGLVDVTVQLESII